MSSPGLETRTNTLREYVLLPIVAKQQIQQIFAKAGTGKTLYSLFEACAVASGCDFLQYKDNGHKTLILYVEGEMDSASIKDRITEDLINK